MALDSFVSIAISFPKGTVCCRASLCRLLAAKDLQRHFFALDPDHLCQCPLPESTGLEPGAGSHAGAWRSQGKPWGTWPQYGHFHWSISGLSMPCS